MKAKVKETGEIIEVFLTTNNNWMVTYNSIDGYVYQPNDLQFQPDPFDINWEQRRWEASLSLLSAMVTETHYTNISEEQIRGSIEIADKLIKEYKKQSK